MDKVLLIVVPMHDYEIFFYEDGSYKYTHWTKGEVRYWTIGDGGGIMFKESWGDQFTWNIFFPSNEKDQRSVTVQVTEAIDKVFEQNMLE